MPEPSKNSMKRNTSGISPVVATVILVAVAIVIAIAVAFWASGLVGVFTRYEKLEIQAAYFPAGGGNPVLHVRNTGSADATIIMITVNGVPVQSGLSIRLTVGASTAITVSSPTGGWQPGVTYEIAIHTAAGKTYPVAVQAP